jgi:pimeloyl-ACP methyl ester carboxylesterase
MTANESQTTPTRTTVTISTKSGDTIEAWLYRPAGQGPHPGIVLAHGLAGIKAGGLHAFAQRFAREGFTTVAFDYRNWGGSTGHPRDLVSVPRQCEDYRTVIDWMTTEPSIDANRIFVWGTSFSGMHVVEIAASDRRIVGAIAQCPLVDGFAGVTMVPPGRSLRLLAAGLRDRLGSLMGRPTRYLTASAPPGEMGLVSTKDAMAGLELIRPKDGTEWLNRVAARSVLGLSAHRPVRRAGAIQCPILLVVAETDTIAPVAPALKVAARAPRSELYRCKGGHYGPYEGGEDHEKVLALEVEFLHRHAQTVNSTTFR